ncbi:hypothetical protein V8E36_008154 [Tilletia maclaganii]
MAIFSPSQPVTKQFFKHKSYRTKYWAISADWRNRQPFRVVAAACLPDLGQAASIHQLERVRLQQLAAFRLRSGTNSSPSTHLLSVDASPLTSCDYGPHAFEDDLGGVDPGPMHPEPGQPDGDIGSDDEQNPFELNPHIYFAGVGHAPPPPKRVNRSRSRFQSWHHQLAHIFPIAYGPEPIIPTGRIQCTCDPSQTPKGPCPTSRVTVYGVGSPFVLQGQCCTQQLPSQIIRAGYFPATPSRPQVAFTMPLLRWYQTFVNSTGMAANTFSDALQEFIQNGTSFQRVTVDFDGNDTLRKQLKGALTWFTTLERHSEHIARTGSTSWKPIRPPLYEDDLSLTLEDLVSSCPACFHGFTTPGSFLPGGPDGPQLIISIDGNFTQKRRRAQDDVGKQPFPPRRFLSARQVMQAQADWLAAKGKDPEQENCVAKIRAIDNSAAQSVNSPFDVMGLMGACCRHDVPLVMCDIETPGERHYYATALISSIIKAVGSPLQHLGVAYDIGCRFDPSTRVRELYGDGRGPKITWTVPVFHVYGHTYACQAKLLRLDGLQQKARAILDVDDGWDPTCIAAHCRPPADTAPSPNQTTTGSSGVSVPLPDTAAATGTSVNTPPSEGVVTPYTPPDSMILAEMTQWVPCAEFEGLPLKNLRIILRMVIERRQLAQTIVTASKNKKIDKLSAVGIYAQDLLRVLAEVRLLTGLIYKRPTATLRGYKTTIRLATSLKAEKASARKLMTKLNVAMHENQPDSSPTPVFELSWATLFEDGTFQALERLAASADPAHTTLPWWAKSASAAAMDAFEQLLRIGEERTRIKLERDNAAKWLKSTILKLRQVVDKHAVYRNALYDMEGLERTWAAADEVVSSAASAPRALQPGLPPVTRAEEGTGSDDDLDDPALDDAVVASQLATLIREEDDGPEQERSAFAQELQRLRLS